MPLEWSKVIEKYGNGAKVPTITGGKFIQVTKADDKAIYVESPIWSAVLERQHIEAGVQLIEKGVISTDPGLFVEDYILYVSSNRATTVAHLMRDLGYLDATETFSIRC